MGSQPSQPSKEKIVRQAIEDEQLQRNVYDEMLKTPDGIIQYRAMKKRIELRLQELKRERCKEDYRMNPYYKTHPEEFPSDATINSRISRIEKGNLGSDCLSSPPSAEEAELQKIYNMLMPIRLETVRLLQEYNQYNKNTQSKDPIPIHIYEKLPEHYKHMYNTTHPTRVTLVGQYQKNVDVSAYPKKGGGKSKKQTKTCTSKRNRNRKQKTIRRR